MWSFKGEKGRRREGGRDSSGVGGQLVGTSEEAKGERREGGSFAFGRVVFFFLALLCTKRNERWETKRENYREREAQQ